MTYPSHWEADVVLADGGTVHLRPISPDDADRLRAMHSRLSPDTVYMRFFSMVRTLPAREVERFTHVDHDDRVAFIALLRDEMVAVARYDRSPGTADAEVAVVVEDAHQGRGLGPLLLEHLAAAGEERGIERFVANVLPANRRMLEVFRSAGFEIERKLADGYVELFYPIQRTAASLSVSRAREHRAEARSVGRLLAPQAIAVVGASREPGTAGHDVFRSLLAHGFDGPVYPVNPAAPHVLGVRTYGDVRDVPDDVDLAVIALPAAQVLGAVEACAQKHVGGLVIVSGGFGDAGDKGRARLAQVVKAARDGGMRLIGPNAMGVVNTDPAVSLHATFAVGSARPGRVGMFSQSGALAGTVLAAMEQRRLGLSTFVSIGDRADVSGNDLLQYWQQDPRTDVVLLHLQGFGNPRKFARIARDVSLAKPVVALKSGRGAGDVAVDALFRSAGVIRVDTLAQLFETAQLLALQPLPAGRRVGIVGTSSALAALAVDSCRSVGLDVVELSAPLQEELQALTGTTETANPVDLGPLASAEQLATALRLVASSYEVDALIALVTLHSDQDALGTAVRDLSAEGTLPVLASFLGHDGVPGALGIPDGAEAAGRGSVPSYASPESAAMALGRAAAYAEWRATPQGEVPCVEVDAERARSLIGALPHDGSWVEPAELLGSYGLEQWPTVRVSSVEEAVLAAGQVGWPVALKHPDDRWRNRVDMGAVRLSVGSAAELATEWASVQRLLGPTDLLVQPMAPTGVSTVVRLAQDPAVGPLLSLRLGGVAADLLADPLTRTLPLTDLDAADLVRSIRGASLLEGHDTSALEDVLHRLARLAEDLPEVAEVLLDPVLVGTSGVTLLHAGVRLLPPEVDPELLPRRVPARYASHLR
ncbi:MAG: CoA-binding domain protein [Frankiales bacterium]|nr:CoA-binding domain protein [Frankiales bacterium]